MNPILTYRHYAPLIAAGFVVLILFLTATVGFELAAPACVSAILIALLMGKPKVLIAVYWVWTAIYPLISYNVAMPLLTYVDEMMLGLIFLVLIAHLIINRPNMSSVRTYSRICVGLVIYGFVSAFVNGVPKLFVIHFFLQYFRFPVLFLTTLLFFQEKDAKAFCLTLMGVFWLQVALNAGWYFHINPLYNHSRTFEDFAIGSLDACNMVAYLTVAVMLVMYARFSQARRPERRLMLMAAFLIMFWQLYITFTMHAYYLLIAGAAVQILFMQRMAWSARIRMALLSGGLAAVFGIIMSLHAEDEIVDQTHEAFSFSGLHDRWEMMVQGPKGQAYKDVAYRAAEDVPYYYLLGAGPGNFSSMVARMYRRPLADKYINYTLLAVDVLDATQGFSITSGPNTAIVALWGDLGPVGMILYISLFVIAGLRVWKQYRAGQYRDPWQRALAEAFVPMLICFGLLCLIVDYLYLAYISSGIWIWAGMVWKAREPERAVLKRPVRPAATARLLRQGSVAAG